MLAQRHRELEELKARGDEVSRSLLELKTMGEKAKTGAQATAARTVDDAKAGVYVQVHFIVSVYVRVPIWLMDKAEGESWGR